MDGSRQAALEVADAIGFVVDRCGEKDDIIGSGFLVDGDKFVTLASFVQPFTTVVEALKIVLPRQRKEMGIEHAYIHPRFDQSVTRMTVERTIARGPDLSFKKYNCAVLKIADRLAPISSTSVSGINDFYSVKRSSWDRGLSGSLAEIDLALAIQTIASAKKSGQLVISDARNRPAARLFFKDGKIFHVQFRHLRKEQAFNQLIASKIKGFFEFRPSKEVEPPILIPTAMSTEQLLLESYRRMDELERLSLSAGGAETCMARVKAFLNKNDLPQDLRDKADSLWYLLDGFTPNYRLWELLPFDQFEVYQIITALLQTGQIKPATSDRVAPAKKSGSEFASISLSKEIKVNSEDDITCICVNPLSALSIPRQGNIVSAADNTDKWHYVHNVPVLFEHVGSPVLKNGRVVGLHCGFLPVSKIYENSAGFLQQMICQSPIETCLTLAYEEERKQTKILDKPLASSGALALTTEKTPLPGASPSLPQQSKVSDSISGERVIGNTSLPKGKLKSIAIVSTATVLAVGFLASGLWYSLPQPTFADSNWVTVPDRGWVKIINEPTDQSMGQWQAGKTDAIPVRTLENAINLSVYKDSYVYLLFQNTAGTSVELLYPKNLRAEKMLKRGASLRYPEKDSAQAIDNTSNSDLQSARPTGSGTLVAVASSTPINFGKDSNLIKTVYEKAGRYILASDSTIGAEIAKKQLFQSEYRKAGTGPSNDMVFLTSLNVKW